VPAAIHPAPATKVARRAGHGIAVPRQTRRMRSRIEAITSGLISQVAAAGTPDLVSSWPSASAHLPART
jgi:hypothetical protein